MSPPTSKADVGGLLNIKGLYPYMDRGVLKSGNLFDNNLESGIYCINQDYAPCINKPNGENYGVYTIEKTTYGYTKVTFKSVTSNNIYTSYKNDNKWGDWIKLNQ